MKKIKKKKSSGRRTLPDYVIGLTHGDPPPPGYVTAWFDQQYGGPLTIQFLSSAGHTHFEAIHTQWRGRINMSGESQAASMWSDQLQWGHSMFIEVSTGSQVGQSKLDCVLHIARLARGLTLLTDGTSYDVATGIYRNPSDWQDVVLTNFYLDEHILIEQQERVSLGQTWFYTRGLSKFGLDELECVRGAGLSEGVVKEVLQECAESVVTQGKVPKIGEVINLSNSGRVVKVVGHRTDQSFGRPIALRHLQWD